MTDRKHKPTPNEHRQIVRYYEQAGEDYGAWSPDFNMHFGYYRWGVNPFRLESMLREMSRQVISGLALPTSKEADRPQHVLDAGCGLGASARLLASENENLSIDGITIVPWQIENARALAERQGVSSRVRFLEADYTEAPFPDKTFDGIYAIESVCHGDGLGKEPFVREAFRLLKAGSRLSIADGFIKGRPPRNRFLAWAYRKVTANWAVEDFAEIGTFQKTLRAAGFEDIRLEDASFRIALSVSYIPWVTLRFLTRELLRNRLRLNSVRWGHILACVLSPIVGMARRRFGYYLISARRPAVEE